MKTTTTILALLVGLALNAQQPANREQVANICGCFDVTFQFAETFAPKKDYKFHDRETISGGTELVFALEETDKRIVMQHLLIITDSIIIKHWREEWTFENPERWIYEGNNIWKKTMLKPEEVKGKWTQTVWEVSDAPRYQGYSEWVKLDGQWIWQNTVDAPLPRREYTTRSDYNILRRTNRLIVTDSGYVHDQDNRKIQRTDDGETLLVSEKGWNTYQRIESRYCEVGLAYWKKTSDYWTSVRKAWNEYMSTHDQVQLKKEIGGKVLHDHLFALAGKYSSGALKKEEVLKNIDSLLEQFLGTDTRVSAR
ncbi:MAG: DUF6607 family protein [Chitinophagaceae bacterium]